MFVCLPFRESLFRRLPIVRAFVGRQVVYGGGLVTFAESAAVLLANEANDTGANET
jgi:hypothetical protein